LIVLLSALAGCTLAKVDVNVVSERTALENQVLGSYNALSDDVLLVASVRGVDPTGKITIPPRKSREYQNAVMAMETLAFHEDDVDAFKRLGWVGENNVGLLAPFPINREKAPDDLQAFAARYPQEEFNIGGETGEPGPGSGHDAGGGNQCGIYPRRPSGNQKGICKTQR
jgi:hypothetical protein